MPCIHLFDRKLRYSSDDLIVPVVYSIIVQVLFLIGTSVLAARIPVDCGGAAPQIFTYAILNAVLLSLFIMNEVIVGYFSLQGTISNEAPRRPVRAFLYIWILLNLADILVQITSISLYATGTVRCDPSVGSFNQGHLAALIFFFLFALYNMGTLLFYLITSKPVVSGRPAHEGRQGFWTGFLWIFFSVPKIIPGSSRVKSATNPNNGSLTWLAGTIAHLFGDDDLTTSDLVAGLVLLKRRQKWEAMQKVKRSSTDSLNTSCASDDGTVDASHDTSSSYRNPVPANADSRIYDIVTFYKYSEAIYGRPLVFLDFFFYETLKLFIPCLDRRSDSPIDVAKRSIDRVWTSCAFCWAPAACQASGGSHPDLIYLSRKCGVFTSPYMIALDHEEKAVVISIRGSMSFADVVTDIHWVPTPITFRRPDGKEDVFYTHGGIWESTKTLYDDLKKRGHLDDLLLREDSPYKNYRIVMVGHSLGAGIAPLLSHMYIHERAYPQNIHAICYAAPGCMTCEKGRDYLSQFCTTFVQGDDIIPRSSPRSYQRMIKRFRHEVKHCDSLRKVDLLKQHTIMRMFARKSERHVYPPVLYDDPAKNEIEFSVNEEFKMYCPGYILHFERRGRKEIPKEDRRTYLGREFVAIWKDGSQFHEVLIKKRTIMDHLPNVNLRVINDWARYSPLWKEVLERRNNQRISGSSYEPTPAASSSGYRKSSFGQQSTALTIVEEEPAPMATASFSVPAPVYMRDSTQSNISL